MTTERANEIEKSVFYRHLSNLKQDLEACEDSHVVFDVGRRIGIMQKDLRDELKKEIQNEVSDSDNMDARR